MTDALEYVENQVLTFSLAEQIHLLNFVANNINKKTIYLDKTKIYICPPRLWYNIVKLR